MDQAEFESHLSRIETQWTAVVHAHRCDAGEAGEARAILLERYGGAMGRYLLASLRDSDDADDLAQEFALRFLRGDFKNADPGRGRFRDYLKPTVYHLMMDHHRRRRANPRFLGDDAPEVADQDRADAWDQQIDQQFLESCAAAHGPCLDRAREGPERTGQPFAAVLRLRVNCPDLRSQQLAEQLSDRLGRPVNAGGVRLNLHRARDMFVESLLAHVEESLGDSSPERLEEELLELGLLEYCRSALSRRQR